MNGLNGFEIERVLRQLSLPDPEPSASKRHCIYQSLVTSQRENGTNNSSVASIEDAMAPVSYATRRAEFERRRAGLNLAFTFARTSSFLRQSDF
jgi:hypothetical protein